jgi:hypothetical protein
MVAQGHPEGGLRARRRTCKAIVEALVDAETTAETPCCKDCLHRAIDALAALAAGK